MLIIVIGRGNSGTRLISDTLSKSGVYMGPVNEAGDLVPPDKMYQAAKIAGKYITFDKSKSWIFEKIPWDYTKLISTDPSPEFIQYIKEYIEPIIKNISENKGWKIPETLLVMPWIFKMFPEAYYIYWTRDPRDTIVTPHVTDDLSKFNVKNTAGGIGYRAALDSWIYQMELMKQTPKPSKVIEIKFEDFVLSQERELNRISEFLKMPLAKVDVDKNQIGNWKKCPGLVVPDHILKKYGYMI